MTEQLRQRRRQLVVARHAGNVPFVLRTVFGLGALGVGINVLGVLIIAALSAASRVTATSHELRVIFTGAVIVTLVCLVIGVSAAVLIQRRTLRWLLRGVQPDEADARAACCRTGSTTWLRGCANAIG